MRVVLHLRGVGGQAQHLPGETLGDRQRGSGEFGEGGLPVRRDGVVHRRPDPGRGQVGLQRVPVGGGRDAQVDDVVGPGRLRKALYFPAVAALRWNPTIRAVRLRLTAAGKPTMVIIGAAMRKLIHLAYGVLKSGKAYEPTFAHS